MQIKPFFYPFTLFIFLLLTLNQIHHINLWGDEAASLNLAEKSISQIFAFKDVHAPSYYFFLKLITQFTGSAFTSEIYIRFIHVMFFAMGIYFGGKIVKLIFHSDYLAMLTMLFSMLIPATLFYAVNIRMYAMLYCFAMWFIYGVTKSLSETEFSINKNWNILLSGFLLAATDYVGVIYYGIGALFLLYKFRKRSLILCLGLPLAAVAVIYAPLFISTLKLIISWPSHAVSATSLQKIIFNMSKPFIELTNISYKNIGIPIFYSVIYGIFLFLGTGLLIKKYFIEKDLRLLFIGSIAYLWLLTALFACSITRLFLPSQFFMSTFILYGLYQLKTSNINKSFLFILFISFNFFLACFPLPRFATTLPYHQIALDTLDLAKKLNVHTILLSNNSENAESIERYFLQQSVHAKKINVNFTVKDLPEEKFLFVDFMNENNRYIDAAKVANACHKKLLVVNRYVDLNRLPYNDVWKKNIVQKSFQTHAYVIYLFS